MTDELQRASPGTTPGALDGVGLRFREEMAGFVAVGAADPRAGAEEGRERDTRLSVALRIEIHDLGRFLRVADHEAALEGTVTFAPLGGTFPVRDGRFQLFHLDPASGTRRMTYAFRFTAADGETYAVCGHKDLGERGGHGVVRDMTTLLTVIRRGEDERAPPCAAGVLRFDLRDALALVGSMEVWGARSAWHRLAARAAFASFAWGALRDEYLHPLRVLYDTQYESLVLSGAARGRDGEVPFFLVSGVHDRGYPWGDGETFSDVLLALGDGTGGWRGYAITDRALAGLEVDVAGGRCAYRGRAFRLPPGASASFSGMRAGAPGLTPCQLDLRLSFDARPRDAVNVAFPLVPEAVRGVHSRVACGLRDLLPGERLPGITITPHAVTVREGRLQVVEEGPGGEVSRRDALAVVAERTFGEAERGAFRSPKKPTLRYRYLCAVRPEARSARVQIRSGTLRDAPVRWGRDRIAATVGSLVSRTSSSELLLEGETARVSPLAPAGRPAERAAPLRRIGEPILEVANDHFPTAVFVRRIVEVLDPSGERCLALEEEMSRMNLSPVRSARTVTVASVRDDDRLRALDRVLEETGFDALVDARLAATGKAPAELLVAVKPNFMFAYDRRDPSTYTDPALVAHLVARLRRRGLERVKVVEAQSTYGEYFANRGVRDVAAYLGYDERAGYEVVDLTEDEREERHLGEHLGRHPVPATWRDADLRISFAKNKTHAYAFYTLTLKNVYGTLPIANKFAAYHCGPGIYETTIEWLRAFPVHYGLVDAWVGAHGPFGVFANPRPVETRTILGGADLVAVDWVGASKMGLDPMVSPHMRLAVEAFGKPAIDLVGDASAYRPWLNVPVALTRFAHGGMDANRFLGNLLYAATAQMDEEAFPYRDRSAYLRLLRRLTRPLRRTFFVRAGEEPSLSNRLAGSLFEAMGR